MATMIPDVPEQKPDGDLPAPAAAPETSPSEVELQALAKGWKPEDQWEGDPEKWIPAKEFVNRQSLFDKIDSQNRRIKQLENGMTAFKQHYEQVNEAAYQRALKTLKEQKRAALQEQDTVTALQLEDRIEQVQEEWGQRQQQAQQTQQSVQPTDTFVNWVKSNNWYAQDAELNSVADGIGMTFFRKNPGVSEQEVLDHVAKEVRKRYPDRFPRNQARGTPSPVDGGTQRSGTTKGVRLPPEAEKQMKYLVDAKVLTKEQYMKDWLAVNGQGE